MLERICWALDRFFWPLRKLDRLFGVPKQDALYVQTVQGLIESLIAFGVALDAHGVISRAELARAFRLLVEQQRRDTATIPNQRAFEARCAAALVLAEFFASPVADRVIAGGKADPT